MEREQFRHFYPMSVRWGDMDALGHINNVCILRYLESGRVAYCGSVLNLSFEPSLQAGWVLADIQCSFREQLRYPCRLDVATRISEIGNKSAGLEAAIFVEAQPKPAVTSRAVVVWFDFLRQHAMPIPGSVCDAIRVYETCAPRTKTNPSGR